MKTLTYTEFYKTLNFMLLHGVITLDQYTHLESKTIPFLKK